MAGARRPRYPVIGRGLVAPPRPPHPRVSARPRGPLPPARGAGGYHPGPGPRRPAGRARPGRGLRHGMERFVPDAGSRTLRRVAAGPAGGEGLGRQPMAGRVPGPRWRSGAVRSPGPWESATRPVSRQCSATSARASSGRVGSTARPSISSDRAPWLPRSGTFAWRPMPWGRWQVPAPIGATSPPRATGTRGPSACASGSVIHGASPPITTTSACWRRPPEMRTKRAASSRRRST